MNRKQAQKYWEGPEIIGRHAIDTKKVALFLFLLGVGLLAFRKMLISLKSAHKM